MSKLSNDDLFDRWQQMKKIGMSRSEFADSLGISAKALDCRLYKANKGRKKSEKAINSEIDDIVDGNYRLLISNTTRIKNVDELIEACGVDLDEWQLDDRYDVGSWEMGRRAEQKSLKWQNGRIESGQVEDTGKLWIETLFRVRATLVRRNPKPINPMVQPVRFEMAKIAKSKAKAIKSGRVLVVPDSQTGYRRDHKTGKLIPFHDRRAHDIVLQVAESGDFDAVTYLGDGLDFTEWSDKFVSEPEFYNTTQPAIIEFAWFLARMKERLPNAQHSFIVGNHEARTDLMMRKHMMAACGLKPATEIELDEPYSISRLLGLRELGISISDEYPNGEIWHGKHVRCIHNDGISSNPGGTAAKMIKEITETTLAGHNHRLEQATKTVDDSGGQRYVTAATCGCLCWLDYRVPGHKRGQHWQQGFAVVQYDAKSPTVELVPIFDGGANFHGRRFSGGDYVCDVAKDTGWAF